MEDMANPFVYGSSVTGDDFVGRDEELANIERELRSGISVILYSHRRMGKTSLMCELARRKPKGLVFAFIDLYGMTSAERLLEQIVSKSAMACLGGVERFAMSAWDLLRSTRLRLAVTPEGELAVDFVRGGPTVAETADALDMPERLASSKGKRLVVVFDEFQEVSALGGVSLLKTMRSRFQHHRNVSYVFSGSKVHLLRQIFEEHEGAFYKSGVSVDLGPIGVEPFSEFIVRKFRLEGGKISKDLARALVQRTGGHPYYTQQLAHELWSISNAPSGTLELDEAMERAMEHQSLAYLYVWESMKSPVQKRLLLALASEPEPTMGVDFILRHGLLSRSHVQRAEGHLVERGLIERGHVVDPMFAAWLRRMSGLTIPSTRKNG